jgi:replicative DNA helicase
MIDYHAHNPLVSIEAEQAIIGSLLLNNDQIDHLANLKPEHFSDSVHRLLYQITCKQILHPERRHANPITVFEALERHHKLDVVGGMPYINALVTGVGGYANVRPYVNIVSDKFKLRAVHSAANALNEACANQGLTGQMAIERAQQVLTELDAQDEHGESLDMMSCINDMLNDVQARSMGESKAIIPTGFMDLDEAFNGGFERGDVVVIAGRPAMGKSAFAFHIALNMSLFYKSLAFSMEMSPRQLTRRSIANLGGIELNKLNKGINPDDDEAWLRLTKASDDLSRRHMHIQKGTGLNAYQIAATCRKHKRQYGLDVVVIDYLGLMDHGNSKSTDAYKIQQTTKAIKAMALDLDVVVLLLCQLNRDGGKGEVQRPNMTHLRDSGGIEQDADAVILLHRDDYYRKEEDKTHDGHTHLIIDKARNCEPCTIGMAFEGKYARFNDWLGEAPRRLDKPYSKQVKRIRYGI